MENTEICQPRWLFTFMMIHFFQIAPKLINFTSHCCSFYKFTHLTLKHKHVAMSLKSFVTLPRQAASWLHNYPVPQPWTLGQPLTPWTPHTHVTLRIYWSPSPLSLPRDISPRNQSYRRELRFREVKTLSGSHSMCIMWLRVNLGLSRLTLEPRAGSTTSPCLGVCPTVGRDCPSPPLWRIYLHWVALCCPLLASSGYNIGPAQVTL